MTELPIIYSHGLFCLIDIRSSIVKISHFYINHGIFCCELVNTQITWISSGFENTSISYLYLNLYKSVALAVLWCKKCINYDAIFRNIWFGIYTVKPLIKDAP